MRYRGRVYAGLVKVVLCLVCQLFHSCITSTDKKPEDPIPEPVVELGSVFKVMDFKTGTDDVEGFMDAKGHVHLLVASSRNKEIYYARLDGNQIVRRDSFPHDSSHTSAKIGPGPDDTVHMIIKNAGPVAGYYVLDGDQWTKLDGYPWDELGLEWYFHSFVPDSTGMAWLISATGGDVNLKHGVELFGFGGIGFGILFPIISKCSKLVLVRQRVGEPVHGYLLDATSHLDSGKAYVCEGSLQQTLVFFNASTTLLVTDSFAKLAAIPAYPDASGGTISNPNVESGNPWIQAWPVSDLVRLRKDNPNTAGVGSDGSLATDPESGLSLLVKGNCIRTTHLFLNDKHYDSSSLPLRTYWSPRLAPAGNNRFHMIAKGSSDSVLYFQFNGSRWTKPVPIGNAGTSGFLNNIFFGFGLFGNGDGSAFAVWPDNDGIYGCWIHYRE